MPSKRWSGTSCSAGWCRSGVTCAASRNATPSTSTRSIVTSCRRWPTPASSCASSPDPDLLLVGALLHDIGKGHTDRPHRGRCRARRPHGAAHGLLRRRRRRDPVDGRAPPAAGRDGNAPRPADPRTAENVAALIGDPLRLELLRALTEADSRATGPSAWSAWKATLLDELTAAVSAVFAGRPKRAATRSRLDDRFAELDRTGAGDAASLHTHSPTGRRLRPVDHRHTRPARVVRQDRRRLRHERRRRRRRRSVDEC